MNLQELADEIAARTLELDLPVPPRFRYFQKRHGPMFCWTTERVEGYWGSVVMVPVGLGSRSGKAQEWQLDEDSIGQHDLRKDAKARALRLFRAWEAGDRTPWK